MNVKKINSSAIKYGKLTIFLKKIILKRTPQMSFFHRFDDLITYILFVLLQKIVFILAVAFVITKVSIFNYSCRISNEFL